MPALAICTSLHQILHVNIGLSWTVTVILYSPNWPQRMKRDEDIVSGTTGAPLRCATWRTPFLRDGPIRSTLNQAHNRVRRRVTMEYHQLSCQMQRLRVGQIVVFRPLVEPPVALCGPRSSRFSGSYCDPQQLSVF